MSWQWYLLLISTKFHGITCSRYNDRYPSAGISWYNSWYNITKNMVFQSYGIKHMIDTSAATIRIQEQLK